MILARRISNAEFRWSNTDIGSAVNVCARLIERRMRKFVAPFVTAEERHLVVVEVDRERKGLFKRGMRTRHTDKGSHSLIRVMVLV